MMWQWISLLSIGLLLALILVLCLNIQRLQPKPTFEEMPLDFELESIEISQARGELLKTLERVMHFKSCPSSQ